MDEFDDFLANPFPLGIPNRVMKEMEKETADWWAAARGETPSFRVDFVGLTEGDRPGACGAVLKFLDSHDVDEGLAGAIVHHVDCLMRDPGWNHALLKWIPAYGWHVMSMRG
jgi:hypothetical protein